MYLKLVDLKSHEIFTGTFAHNGEVYKITADGDLYRWDGNAQLGGFFSKIGKVLKKANSQIVKQGRRDWKTVKKVAPYIVAAAAIYVTAGAAAGYFGAAGAAGAAGTAGAVGAGAAGTAAASAGWSSALWSAAGSVGRSVATSLILSKVTGRGKAQQSPNGGIQYQDSNGNIISKNQYDALNAAAAMPNRQPGEPVPIDPVATQAAQAFYNYQAAQQAAQMQGNGLAPGTTGTPASYFSNLPPDNNQPGLPAYSGGGVSSNYGGPGFNLPTTEQAPQGIPDVSQFTGLLTKYKTPITIGLAALGLILTLHQMNRGRK